MATTPTLSVTFTGDTYITSLSKDVTWSAGSKLEQDYTLNSVDGEKTIDLTPIDNIAIMAFESSTAFKVEITVSTQVIEFEVNNILIFDPTTTFSGTITGLTISTDSASDITVAVRIYGEAS